MPRQLLVESIRIDGDTQSRVRIDEETVTEYAEAMRAPASSAGPGPGWPPVVVFHDGTEFWLADGFHRLLAAKRIGRKNIVADVKNGSREDAAWAACAANQTHGLRRTNADKRNAVEIALRLRTEMSDEGIGRHVGVSREYTSRTRTELKRQGVIKSHPDARVGVDGKQYRLSAAPPRRASQGVIKSHPDAQSGVSGGVPEVPPPPSKREAQGVIKSHPAALSDEREEGDSPPPPRPAARPPAEPDGRVADGPVDEVGRRIPEHLLELWARRQEVQDMLTALSRIRATLRKAQDTQDRLYSAIPFSTAQAHLDQAYGLIQMAKPFAVCACCQGHGCRTCQERGLLGKFHWDTGLPRELKEAVAKLVEKESAAS